MRSQVCWGKPTPGVWLAPFGWDSQRLSSPFSHLYRVCWGQTLPGSCLLLGWSSTMGEWTTVTRRGATPPRWAMEQELQDLREEMAWMRSRMSAPPQGSKGKGKGKAKQQAKAKGDSQGAPPPAPVPPASSEGPARRRPNLKPNEERAAPTLIEIKCQKCQAYNLDQPRGLQVLRNTLSQATGCFQQFHSAVAAVGQAIRHYARQELRGCRRRLPTSKPVCLDSATAGVKKATARREKAEETLKQAQEALEQARLQESKAIKKLEEAKAAAAPAPPPRNPPAGLRVLVVRRCCRTYLFFQELAEEREAAPGAEPPSKRGRVGPYGETPSMKATKDAAVRAKLERGQAY